MYFVAKGWALVVGVTKGTECCTAHHTAPAIPAKIHVLFAILHFLGLPQSCSTLPLKIARGEKEVSFVRTQMRSFNMHTSGDLNAIHRCLMPLNVFPVHKRI